jgi:hypothetical protein
MLTPENLRTASDTDSMPIRSISALSITCSGVVERAADGFICADTSTSDSFCVLILSFVWASKDVQAKEQKNKKAENKILIYAKYIF